MGGEGVPWVGVAPFTKEKHVFANLGDGTYFHSGSLAIRQAIASGANITYKILYNDATAMTGGQHVDGELSPQQITFQLHSEGIRNIYLVSENPQLYPASEIAPGVITRHRDELDAVMKECRELKGTSAIVFVQTCAAEKRRRRKRGLMEDPARRVMINPAVCEGCGDCSVQSNCLSVEPLETEFGRKRTINQSACNKDYSCLKGFCPSFVTVEGGALRKGKAAAGGDSDFPALSPPPLQDLARPHATLVTGIGGMGVITIGQIVAMAAHLEGKGATVLDMSGLAQKFGPVMSHVRIARSPGELHSVRVGLGAADLVLGCDLVVTTGTEALSKMNDRTTRVVANATVSPTAEFVKNPDWQLPGSRLEADLVDAAGAKNVDFVPAGKLATALMGDAIATNMFMLGYAFQKGAVPLAEDSLLRAIELNGVAVDFNKRAFLWGRRAAVDLPRVERLATPAEIVPISQAFSRNLDEMIARRVEFLTAYQDAAY